jgi:hypothetical protein
MHNVLFTAYFVNKWYTDKNSFESKRTKALKEKIQNGFSKYKSSFSTSDTNAIVEIRNLRASAGNILFDSIYNKMKRAKAIIVDVSSNDGIDFRNIWLELGIAVSLAKINDELKVFILYNKNKKGEDIPCDFLPSDLHGYFISGYIYNEKNKENQIVFDDQGSFLSSLHFMAQDYFRDNCLKVAEINEEKLLEIE